MSEDPEHERKRAVDGNGGSASEGAASEGAASEGAAAGDCALEAAASGGRALEGGAASAGMTSEGRAAERASDGVGAALEVLAWGLDLQAPRAGSPASVACGHGLPCIIVVDDDAALRRSVLQALGPACETHATDSLGAVALLRGLAVVDVALVDCDQPPSAQAPIFNELARWPGAICVLMSANVQKVEQMRALGVFAPLMLDKPVQLEALEAIRSATLELSSGR